jgi:hypothetical protein
LDIETGEKPIRFRESVAIIEWATPVASRPENLVESFGLGAFGTAGNVRVQVGGWFSAESARLGDGLSGCVCRFLAFVDLSAQHSSVPRLIIWPS